MKKQDAKREMNFSNDFNEKPIKKLLNELKGGDAIVCQPKSGIYEVRGEKEYLEKMFNGEYEIKTEAEKNLFKEFFTAVIRDKINVGNLLHGDQRDIKFALCSEDCSELFGIYLLKEKATRTDEEIDEIANDINLAYQYLMPTLIYVVDESFPFRITDILTKALNIAA